MMFGGFSIDRACFDKIREILPGGVILEMGSGPATAELAKHYTMYSVEHNEKWMNVYDSMYIYAPLVDGWYDVGVLEAQLPDRYDLILVDGPPSTISRNIRMGFYFNIHLFRQNVPIVFDDVQRLPEFRLMMDTATYLDRDFWIGGDKKKFAVV